MPIKKEDLDDIFSSHPPEGDAQLEAYADIRARGKELAEAILDHTAVCGDQQAAIRKVREACFTANAAIALKGKV